MENNMGKAIDKVKYRGKRIKVYADDYGQCYYFIYKGHEYCCGTYNPDYLGEIVSVVDADLSEEFHVDAIEPHSPSAKVYNLFGVWYMDYFGYEKLFVSYGYLLRKKDRPSRGRLIELAQAGMRTVLDEIKGKDENRIGKDA